jgi:hypothetical protein
LQALGFDMPRTVQLQYPRAGLERRVCGYPAQSLSLFEGSNDSGGLAFRQTRPLAQNCHESLSAATPAGGDVCLAVIHEALRRFSESNRIDHSSLLC